LMVLKLEFALQLLRRPVEAQTTGSYTWVSAFVGLGWSLRICMPTSSQGMLMPLVHWQHFEDNGL
jgi:hypothetical protein